MLFHQRPILLFYSPRMAASVFIRILASVNRALAQYTSKNIKCLSPVNALFSNVKT